MTLTGVLAYNDIFFDFSSTPPPFFVVLLVPLIAVIWATSTSTVKSILLVTPPHHVVYLQSFRIVVEVLLWMLLLDNLIPVQMSFEGRNFDILVGLTALPTGYLLSRGKIQKKGVVIWNLFGLALLINIVTIAILSTPMPFRVFMNEPANTIVTRFPVVWLPALLVPLAYGLHILSLKQALRSEL
jgi:hypothetical protein